MGAGQRQAAMDANLLWKEWYDLVGKSKSGKLLVPSKENLVKFLLNNDVIKAGNQKFAELIWDEWTKSSTPTKPATQAKGNSQPTLSTKVNDKNQPVGQRIEPTLSMKSTSMPDLKSAMQAVDKRLAQTQPTKAGAGSQDSFELAKNKIRAMPKMDDKNLKQLPAPFAAALKNDLDKLAKGSKDFGVYAADRILKYADAGYNVGPVAQKWVSMAKAGERFLTASQYRAITNMLKEHGLKWTNLGIRCRLNETTKNVVFISKTNSQTNAE